MRRRRFGIALALASIAAWSVAGAASAADQSVTMAGFAFSPGSVTVTVGDSVTWSNGDEAPHTATAAGAFDTGTVAPGASASVTFDTAGTFAYVCSIHPAMTGTVVVEAAAGGGGGGATPPPTDTATRVTAATDDPAGMAGVWLLAILGVAMIVGTVAFGRREETSRASND